ncbi:MAG: redoxin domain-containing protein [Bacteroidales bacterium]|nr:redoxin domain-containing protein [Bacteroidales bacterium]
MYKISVKKIQEEKHIENIQVLPLFSFNELNSSEIFTDSDIAQNKPLLIIYFHPECEFCSEQANEISQKIQEFNPYQILYISNARASAIDSFVNNYGLAGKVNIIFLQDKDLIFNDIFGRSGVPVSFVYNKNKELVKQFKGEAKIEELLKCLKE